MNGLALTGAYLAAAVLGLQWAQISGAGSPVWPAFGIGLAGMLLGGVRLWPAILIGRFLAGIIVGSAQPLWAEIAIAAINAFADGAGAWLLIRYGRIDTRLPALRDVLWLAFGVAAAAALSATLGAATLAASSGLDAATTAKVWLGWWLGNVVAGLTITPLILTWSQRESWSRTPAQWAHLAACIAVVAAVAAGIFLHTESDWLRTWHVYPALIWAALAFNVRGASAGLVITAAMALVGSSLGTGFIALVDEDLPARILSAQQFAAATALTTLVLAAIAHERRRVQEAAQLTAIVSSTPDAIITYSPQGLIQSWNEGAEALFGHRAGDVIGRSAEFLLPPEQPEGPRGVFDMAMEQRQVGLETVRMTSGGERIDVGITASRMHGPDGSVLGVAAVMRDIRALKERERTLREREAHLSAFFRQSAAGMSEADATGRFLRVNDRFCEITGRSRDELLALRMHDITHPDDLTANVPLFRRTIEEGTSFEIEKRYLRPDGSIVWVHNSVTALRDAPTLAASTTCVTIDITDRRLAEAKLRESEARQRAITEATPECIKIVGRNGQLVHMNQAGLGMIEAGDLESVLEADTLSLIAPEHQAAWRANHQRVLKGERINWEFDIIGLQGTRRRMETHAVPLTLPDGTVAQLAVTRDVTQRKRAEEHQRLLINELNHRVKNTLAIVQAVAQQTFKGGAATFAARQAFEGRLLALSEAHNVLTEQNWESASIREIGEGAAAPYRAERFEIEGPDLRVPPKTSVSLALALHELSTNAVKYGALSTPGGRVHISWRNGGERLKLVWRESGGPSVTPPQTRGFGTRMIERGLSAELGGEVRIEFAADGLVCAVDAPLPRVEAD